MARKRKITVPFEYTPREYQLPLFQAFDDGFKRFVTVWHRRAGKDKSYANLMAKAMLERVGVYYYFFPTYAQGKKIMWDGIDGQGFRFLDHFPKELIDGQTNSTEMKLRFKNGSLFQVVGADNIDSIVGTNPVGCIFSEYALQDPRGWDFVRPILRENKGWAAFNFTPRGKNHGFKLYQMAKDNPDWFCQLLTIDDTHVLSDKDIEDERASGMDEELIQQEYYCSFESAMQGAYYANQLNRAEEEGRITSVAHDPALPVDTYWDLGIGDSTAIWFTQTNYNEIRIIDYYETSGEGLPYYRRYLDGKEYNYGTHYAPHDIEVRELGSGRSRLEIARSLGIDFQVIPKLRVEDGIEAARAVFPRCWFDKERCAQGLDALMSYRKEWDIKRQEFKQRPYHDWSSHAADAFRYFAVGHRDARTPHKRERYNTRYANRIVRPQNWKMA